MKTVKLLNTVDIDIIPHDELKRRYALMAEKLQLEINKTKDLSDRLEVSQEGAIERNELEKKYLSLRQAHIAQAAYIQKLQVDITSINLLKIIGLYRMLFMNLRNIKMLLRNKSKLFKNWRYC